MTSRTILLPGLVIVLALVTNLILDRESPGLSAPAMQENDPDQYMRNPVITQFNEQGHLKHRLKAEQLTHFPLTDLSTLRSPRLELTGEDGAEPWKIRARNGRLLPETGHRKQTLELWDEVHAIRRNDDGSYIAIDTRSLTVYPDQQFAETDEDVVVDDNSRNILAAGMEAWFGPTRFVFSSTVEQRVRSVLLPGDRVN